MGESVVERKWKMAMQLTEVESCSTGDTARSLLSVRKRSRDRQLSLSSNSHSDDSLLPTSNNLTSTKSERQLHKGESGDSRR